MTTEIQIENPSAHDHATRFRCRHIFTDGRRCASPSLRSQDFCYYHHTARLPIPQRQLERRRAHRAGQLPEQVEFAVPDPEDRSAIQRAIGEVLQRIASNTIDPRRAALMLYGLQIASLNLGKSAPAPHPDTQPAAAPAPLVEIIQLDDDLGPLAPTAEFEEPAEKKGTAQLLLEELNRLNDLTPRNAPNSIPTSPSS